MIQKNSAPIDQHCGIYGLWLACQGASPGLDETSGIRLPATYPDQNLVHIVDTEIRPSDRDTMMFSLFFVRT
jgi:hypothetical protein